MKFEDRIVIKDGIKYRLVIIDDSYIYSTLHNPRVKKFSLSFMYKLFATYPYKFSSSTRLLTLLLESNKKTLSCGYL